MPAPITAMTMADGAALIQRTRGVGLTRERRASVAMSATIQMSMRASPGYVMTEKFQTCVGPTTSGVKPSSRRAARGSSSVPKVMSQRWMSSEDDDGHEPEPDEGEPAEPAAPQDARPRAAAPDRGPPAARGPSRARRVEVDLLHADVVVEAVDLADRALDAVAEEPQLEALGVLRRHERVPHTGMRPAISRSTAPTMRGGGPRPGTTQALAPGRRAGRSVARRAPPVGLDAASSRSCRVYSVTTSVADHARCLVAGDGAVDR